MMNQVDDIAKETLIVLNYFSADFVSKIPNKFIENLKKIAKTSEIAVQIDEHKELEEQKISEECKDLISLIYYNYIANEEDKKEILKCWNENEQKYQEELNEKYNVGDIFKKINVNIEEREHTNLPQVVKKHNFLQSIWEKIKKLIKR